LRKIRSSIGATCHLARAALVQQVLGQFEGAQVVIVSGAARAIRARTSNGVRAPGHG